METWQPSSTHSEVGTAGQQPCPTDRALIQAVLGGNHQAFGTLVNLYERRIFALCLMVTKNHAEAEEVAQDTFVRAYANLARFDTSRAFYPWLATIAVRVANSRLRKQAQDMHRDTAYVDEPTHSTSAPDTPLAAMMRQEASEDIWARVSALPEAQRTATFLFYRDDMSIVEVATALGVTAGTVKTLLHRARLRLRGELTELPAPEHKEQTP
ncbi:RNA polymerase sigma factor [Kordiimonas gwangyangensis]|uniref:RNA polymerase sigma factor n=1 Tax=Kordiimonas gwangyangensis TaxID=288022 RepID=UPI000375139F|nr:sigma-70 family RNA polymerase sigma factor [Kordiimonas gwangyangensis]